MLKTDFFKSSHPYKNKPTVLANLALTCELGKPEGFIYFFKQTFSKSRSSFQFPILTLVR